MLGGKYLATLAMLLSTQPAIADNPRKIAISPGSSKGALLFKVPPSPITYQLLFTRNDKNGRPSEVYWIGIKGRPSDEGDRFIVETLPPGQYQLEAVYQQSKWAACLEAATVTVSIEPGKIAYLGTLDALPTLAGIQRNARATNQLSAQTFQWHLFRTGVVAPRVSDRDPDSLVRAESFVREHIPRSLATVTLADFQWRPYVRSETSGRPDRCN